MNRRALTLLSLIAGLSAFSCTSLPKQTVSHDSPNLISRETIERMNASTAWDVLVTRLNRPPTVPVRGSSTSFERPQQPMIMIDGNRSEVAALQTLPATNIEEIRILNAGEGTWRYGTGATNGVIVITTRRAR